MFQLKKLSKEAIPAALEKAERYRLLNEPFEAASICQDVLMADPENQQALIMVLLAHTDKFKKSLFPAFKEAEEITGRLSDEHCRAYYLGIVYERRAKIHMEKGGPGSGELAHDWFIKAMAQYERALNFCDPENQDATLRWNTCARILNENPHVKPRENAGPVEISDAYE